MPTKLALLLTISVLALADSTSKVLKSWQEPLPDSVDLIVTAIEDLLGSKPSITAKVSDVSAEGEAPKFEASLSLTDAPALHIDSAPFSLPGEMETILSYLETVTKTKPEIDIDVTIVEVPAVAA